MTVTIASRFSNHCGGRISQPEYCVTISNCLQMRHVEVEKCKEANDVQVGLVPLGKRSNLQLNN